MAAPVRVETAAFSDPRIELLGQLAGYNRYEALGRLTHLWSACTEKQFHVATEAMVRACIGPSGVQHMLDAELAERVEGGLRVKGTAGRIEWHGEYTEKRAAAGAKRAATAQRDSKGRMVSSTRPASESAGPAHPAHAGESGSAPAGVDQHTSTSPAHAGHAGPSASSTHQQASSGSPAESSALTPTLTPTLRLIPSGSAPEAGTKAKDRRAPEHPLPANWNTDAAHAALARERGVDLHLEVERFRAHAEANDRRARNWAAAFRQWLLKAQPDRRSAAQSEIRTNYQPL